MTKKLTPKEWAALPAHEAKEYFRLERVEHLEELLEHMGVIRDSFSEQNDFPLLAKANSIVQHLLDELDAARKGWDFYENWLKQNSE